MNINDLNAKRADLLRKAQAIIDGAKAADRERTPEEEAKLDTITAEVKSIEAQAEAEKKNEERNEWISKQLNGLKTSEGRKSVADAADAIKDADKFRVPAEAIRSTVRSFEGPNAEWKAYAFGTWCKWAYTGDMKSAKWLSERGIIEPQAAQYGSSNNAGGFVVPQEFSSDLIRLVLSYGTFRRNSRVIGMMTDKLTIPRRSSGLTAYFVGEANSDSATAITKSSMAGANVQLSAKKLATLTLVSPELLADAAISVGDLLAEEIALSFANKEDDCGWNGTGTSTYGGIQGVMSFVGSASKVTAATGNTAFSTLDLADFHSVVGKLPTYARTGAKWYVSPAGFSDSMERLMYAGGGNTTSLIGGGSGLSFLGYPVELVEVLNSTLTAQTSTNILAFGNLAQATLFGDRQGTEVELSRERYFDTHQVAVRGIERFDIACHTFNSTSAAGPMIVLATPAS